MQDRTRAFRREFFPTASAREWNDWRWQLRQRIRSPETLERILELTTDERAALRQAAGQLRLAINPYYASLLDRSDPEQPLRRTVVMCAAEHDRVPGEADDPLGEDGHMPVPGLVHRYPDRVLFLVSLVCPVFCRYCTRSRMVGGSGGHYRTGRKEWEQALQYIAATPSVRDVLLSGGDPLLLSDDHLDWLLTRLRQIPHVEFVRLGTKVPAALPQRVTPALVRMLRRHSPIWLSIHFVHPDELTSEVAQACGRLANAGMPLGSQTVLLRGVNDDASTLRRLFHGLLQFRVRPYYLYQCDPVAGSAHFRVPVSRGLELIGELRGHTTGYAVPTYVIDLPGGGGKIPLTTNHLVSRQGAEFVFRNYEGKLFRYPDSVRDGEAELRKPVALCQAAPCGSG